MEVLKAQNCTSPTTIRPAGLRRDLPPPLLPPPPRFAASALHRSTHGILQDKRDLGVSSQDNIRDSFVVVIVYDVEPRAVVALHALSGKALLTCFYSFICSSCLKFSVAWEHGQFSRLRVTAATLSELSVAPDYIESAGGLSDSML
ncbi:uncharacterized protein LOC130988931 isoform X1 [Salvia miltiorrhiza]|uniref:uncharacterized protein LOC130988931 isoform X1 n=1 Tax=Salvia miltiorrhiza TaxID=226208 RepID=UPI0025AD7625|nr:uncharacterized protein LOC130988931 isoform X1 [Salvia miltiorrhiza]